MPELPEIETIRRGLAPLLIGRRIERVVVRTRQLRLPVTPELSRILPGACIDAVERRAKYLLLRTTGGTLIVHLGMSGTLRTVPLQTPAARHDHIDLVLDNGQSLRLRDPRRFGLLVWTADNPLQHPLLAHLGPEPLSADFSAERFHVQAAGRRCAIKTLLMDQRIVVGVGNIYASEALFRAGILPQTPAGQLARERCQRLVPAVQDVLREAIAVGGTTLRDFHNAEGKPGYFALQLQVYGREGEACVRCHEVIRCERIGQRSSFYCPRCQQ